MAPEMWTAFYTPPGGGIVLKLVTVVDETLAHPPAGLVVEFTVNTVIVYCIEWADAVHISDERSILNAVQRTCTITTEAEDRI